MPKNTAKKALADYEKYTNILVQEFIKKYYCCDEVDLGDVDYWWIGDEIGGVLEVDEQSFGMNIIRDSIRLDFTIDELFDYYNYAQDEYLNKKNPCNIKNWRHMKSLNP
jgi:hypothetical protein